MAGRASQERAEEDQGSEKKKREKNRGTQDELQIMALIVMENPYIKSMVMDRLSEVVKRTQGAALGGREPLALSTPSNERRDRRGSNN